MIASGYNSQQIAAGKRQYSRLRVGLPATFQLAGASGPCQLIDLSATGACFTTDERMKAGATVLVQCLHLELFGTVVWCGSKLVGMEFDERLPLDQVVSLRGVAGEVARAQKEELRRAAQAWARGWGS